MTSNALYDVTYLGNYQIVMKTFHFMYFLTNQMPWYIDQGSAVTFMVIGVTMVNALLTNENRVVLIKAAVF